MWLKEINNNTEDYRVVVNIDTITTLLNEDNTSTYIVQMYQIQNCEGSWKHTGLKWYIPIDDIFKHYKIDKDHITNNTIALQRLSRYSSNPMPQNE